MLYISISKTPRYILVLFPYLPARVPQTINKCFTWILKIVCKSCKTTWRSSIFLLAFLVAPTTTCGIDEGGGKSANLLLSRYRLQISFTSFVMACMSFRGAYAAKSIKYIELLSRSMIQNVHFRNCVSLLLEISTFNDIIT